MGPDWMPSERFDIHAKLPTGGRDQLREMLQTLLEQRFQMKMHRTTKEFPVYGLTVNKGALKLKESPLDPLPEGAEGGRGAPVNVTATGGRGGSHCRCLSTCLTAGCGRSSSRASAGPPARSRCGTTARRGTSRSTTTRASAASCTASCSRAARQSPPRKPHQRLPLETRRSARASARHTIR